jgi:TldD protein
MDDVLAAALDAASDCGATYADARSVETVTESLSMRGPAMEGLDRSDSIGVGVRVLYRGAWGYAAGPGVDRAAAIDLARSAIDVARASAAFREDHVELAPEPPVVDTWQSPCATDPFSVSLEDKLDVLLAATAAMDATRGLRFARASMDFERTRTHLMTTDGSDIDQTVTHGGAGLEATAVGEHEVQQRSYPASFRGDLASAGYEFVEAMRLADHAESTASEAVALLSAPECPELTTTLVLDGHQVMMQVHESIGHATELDRVLGMEASYAGTSFLDLAHLGSFQFGSEIVNVSADATIPGGVGSFAYDDEAVAAQSVPLISAGVLVGFQSSRETAAAMGAARSNGTMRAEGWANFPLIRMTNINLLPGEGAFEDLIADVDEGIYMATNRSWSIDDKRKNFQFGCEIAWEIKRGRLARMLKNPRYTGITPVFWNECDAIAGPGDWRMWGTPNCGKGHPAQTMKVGHGTAPARFRNASVGVGL